MKYATRNAKYVLANNLIASASVESVYNCGIFSLIAPSASNWPKRRALSESSPTTIRDGCKLSYKALPSRKNSGEKIKFSVLNSLRICTV